jgi:hypothetical protein
MVDIEWQVTVSEIGVAAIRSAFYMLVLFQKTNKF